MHNIKKTFSVKKLLQLLLASSMLLLSGCASFYLDTATPELSAAQFKQPQNLQSVQLLFEFQTKGVFNASATEFLKAQVLKQVQESGLFSEVTEGVSSSNRTLTIALNNVPVDDDAFAKGFATGFTFGLVGSQVTDGYVCNAYLLDNETGSAQLSVNARHALHTTLGSKGAPKNAVKMKNIDEAVRNMTTQIISHILNDLSKHENFS